MPPDISTLRSYWCWAQQEAAFGISEVLHCTWLPSNLSGCLGLNLSPLPAKELGLRCHQFFQLGRSLVQGKKFVPDPWHEGAGENMRAVGQSKLRQLLTPGKRWPPQGP